MFCAGRCQWGKDSCLGFLPAFILSAIRHGYTFDHRQQVWAFHYFVSCYFAATAFRSIYGCSRGVLVGERSVSACVLVVALYVLMYLVTGVCV
jgi:hypothetical protein